MQFDAVQMHLEWSDPRPDVTTPDQVEKQEYHDLKNFTSSPTSVQ